jgi:hypothetical protein
MKRLLAVLCVFASTQASAVVTYLNCPTLSPLPVVAFEAAAMVPINNVENAFDAGMNVTVANAVKASNLLQAQSIAESYTTIMKEYINSSRTHTKDLMEYDQKMFDLKMSYLGELAVNKSRLESSLFPSDPINHASALTENNNTQPGTPSFTYLSTMCSMAKMNKAAFDAEKQAIVNLRKTSRNQQITEQLVESQSASVASKQLVDFHYDVFCSESEAAAGVCESASLVPNLDLSAFNLLYPSGYAEENISVTTDYKTLYTYNPVESFAAYQYTRNLVGVLPVDPPSRDEINNPSTARFVGAYKLGLSSLSLASDAILYTTSLREPINGAGVVMSQLDALNYQLANTSDPNNMIFSKTASDNGVSLAIAQQLAMQNMINFLMLKQEDYERVLAGAHISVDSFINNVDN